MVTRPADDDQPPSQPLRVVRGDATPEEIAALAAVLFAARSADTEAPSPPRSAQNAWCDRSRLLRRPLSPGPGAWRRSALPG
jgi:Acyl-CoA carboxylase epsilon subunit